MSFEVPAFVPNQISDALRALYGRGFQSPLNVALVTALPLIALYTTIPALASGPPTKPKPHPSLDTLVTTKGSRVAELKKRAQEIYPPDIYGHGHSIDLPKGRVKYWLIGPEGGKRVVLIHGISMPSLIWKPVANRLAKAGFRVLIFDLYGRGYSEAPDARTTTYDAELYVTQLALLLQAVGWRKARIVGLSMGGGVAAAFASQFPWLVESHVTFIASVGVMDKSIGTPASFWFGSAAFQRLVHSNIGKIFYAPPTPPPTASVLSSSQKLSQDLQTLVALQGFILPGYTAAVAASVYVGPLRGLEKAFQRVGKLKDVKVQLIWGKKDNIVDYKYAGKIKSLIPHAELTALDDAKHDLCVTHSDAVADALIKFLNS
ncbi:alpha/beta hydrolase family protein [Ceratobasidium sp. AG-Ba]|nr:alpha/beta hydrolase family protein [Ceratobasidium sp. AG-Ba]